MAYLDHQLECGATFQPNRHTQRLLQRLQHPMGVVDLQRPLQMYERTAGWLGRRFSLLDRWNLRYGSSTSEIAWPGAGDFSAAAEESIAGSPIPLTTSGFVNYSPVATGTEVDSAPQQFRVRRQTTTPLRNEPSSSEVQNTVAEAQSGPFEFVTSVVHAPVSKTVAGDSIQRKEAGAAEGRERSMPLEMPLQTDVRGSSAGTIQRKADEVKVRGSWTRGAAESPLRSHASRPSVLTSLARDGADSETTETAIQTQLGPPPGAEEVDASASSVLMRVNEIHAVRGLFPSSMPLQLFANETESSDAGATGTPIRARSKTILWPESSPVPGPESLQTSSRSAPLQATAIYTARDLFQTLMPLQSWIAGQNSPAIGAVRAQSSQTPLSPVSLISGGGRPATTQRRAKTSSAPVIRELSQPGTTSAAGRMIWRKSEASRFSAPALQLPPSSSPATIQRFAAESTSSTPSSSFISDAPADTARRNSGVNIAQMVEEVGRLLARRLVIERERRGRSL